MSTISITRRPIPVAAAAAAAVVVLAFAGVTIAQGGDGSSPAGTSPQQALHHGTSHPPTTGGRVELGLP